MKTKTDTKKNTIREEDPELYGGRETSIRAIQKKRRLNL